MKSKPIVYIVPNGEEYPFAYQVLTGDKMRSYYDYCDNTGYTFIPTGKIDDAYEQDLLCVIDSPEESTFDYVSISKEYCCFPFTDVQIVDISNPKQYLEHYTTHLNITLPADIFRALVQASQIKGMAYARNILYQTHLIGRTDLKVLFCREQLPSSEKCTRLFLNLSHANQNTCQLVQEIFDLQTLFSVEDIRDTFIDFIRMVRRYLLNPEDFIQDSNVYDSYKQYVSGFVRSSVCSIDQLIHKVNYYLYAPRSRPSDETRLLIDFIVEVLSFLSSK